MVRFSPGEFTNELQHSHSCITFVVLLARRKLKKWHGAVELSQRTTVQREDFFYFLTTRTSTGN
jgi:hypothetical protein